MKSKINEILKEVLERVNPPEKDLEDINNFLKKFINSLEKKFKELKIKAEIFIGGSFAKKTLIRKGQYDIDIFVRFEEQYKEKNISKILKNALSKIKEGKISVIHGSRDYFKIDVSPIFFIEIVPVLKIKKPKDAKNITDLSYFHVNYIKRKLNAERMLEEVRLAKAFCHANKCYGAESYINGFSGYAIELLVYYYKGFLNFIKAMTKIKGKEIIDIEKQYKNKYEIDMNMNSAKLSSPIVIIDPTYKERNALAALSKETLKEFENVCKKFLKKPTEEAFELKKINLEKIRKSAIQKKLEFILVNAGTDKQEGDVAGSKLVKFYRHLKEEISKLYKTSNSGFEYNEKKEAEYFFVVKRKDEIISKGPNVNDKKNVIMFKKKHRVNFIKGGRIYAREKVRKNIKEFIREWIRKNSKKMKEMHIKNLKIADYS